MSAKLSLRSRPQLGALAAAVLVILVVVQVASAGPDGSPSATTAASKPVKKLKQKIRSLERRIAALEARPAATAGPQGPPGVEGQPGQAATAPVGLVAFFNLAACPAGWVEFTGARGRYLVGRPLGGTLNAAVGTALANGESRSVGFHSHTVNDPGHSHSLDAGTNDSITATAADQADPMTTTTSSDVANTAFTGVSIDPTGAFSGTNAPYLQLTACAKT